MGKMQDIIGEYTAKTPKSRDLYDKAKETTPGGVHSPIRYFEPYPFFVERGKGSKIWDIDGNEYIDYCLSYGPVIAGHGHPKIVNAVKEQMEKGSLYGAPTELAVAFVKELLRRYPMMDMFRFTNSGGEATMYAVRAARAYTGKDKIVKIEGCYHGAHDYLLISDKPPLSKTGPRWAPTPVVESDGVPQSTAENTLVAPYNNIEAMEKLFKKHDGEIAAVILEPVMGTSSVILPKNGYLSDLRKLTREYGVVLIFDEVKTGCRVAPGGVCELYNVEPDMITLAKVIGGGLPLGAFGGRKEIMSLIAPLGGTVHYGTYNACPVAVAAGYTCLKEVLTDDAYRHLNKLGEMLLKGARDVIEDVGVKAQANALGPMGNLLFTDTELIDYRTAAMCDEKMWRRYWLSMIKQGIIITGNAWYEPWFISVAHTEEDITKTIETLENVLHRITK